MLCSTEPLARHCSFRRKVTVAAASLLATVAATIARLEPISAAGPPSSRSHQTSACDEAANPSASEHGPAADDEEATSGAPEEPQSDSAAIETTQAMSDFGVPPFGDGYPNITEIVFAEPSEDQRKSLLSKLETIERMSVSHDRFLARCEGTMSLSGNAGASNQPFVRLVEFRFMYAMDAEGGQTRLVSVENDIFTHVPREAERQNFDAGGLQRLPSERDQVVDLLTNSDGRTRAAIGARGGRKKLQEGRDSTELMTNRVVFNPFNAIVSSAAEIRNRQLIDSTFEPFNRSIRVYRG